MTRAFLSFFAASGGVSGCQVPTSSDWQLLKLQFSPLLADWPVAMMEGKAECPKNQGGGEVFYATYFEEYHMSFFKMTNL